ncbi:MAG: hypothetical protein AUG74_14855 [Bacteroidetes bacterium 13_1_20CM_4_60_6]|nr:MAG: hypothetical protein AUG74_14855 [Bacteroidetes bacterium 13_1_20CM_4_60_6]
MKYFLLIPLLQTFISGSAQTDSSQLIKLGKETVLSEVVIRSDFNTVKFLQRVKDDTTFYKAFRNLHVIGYTSLNDIKMLDKDHKITASLYSKTRQKRENGCRTMQILEEKTTGDMYRGRNLNFYTAELYAGLFFTRDKVCGETNIVKGMDLSPQGKSGIEKHKEQLKMLFFNPGKRIPGIPFIGNRIDIFDPEISRNYEFSIDMGEMSGQNCYIFKILPKDNLSSDEKRHLVFDNITTWFNSKTMEIVARNYDLSYDTPLYDFNVHMEVQMTRFGDLLIPQVLRYNGDWKIVFKKRERGIFTATLFDYESSKK